MGKREEVLFDKVKQKAIHIEHVCEVGVYLPETSNIGAFAKNGVRATFVEPDPKSVEAIKEYYKNYKNIKLVPVAIYDKSGTVELVQRKASTYLKVLDSSPAIINDEYTLDENDTFIVDALTFDQVDDGTIDLLSIDIEGGEWFVIKHMQSQPQVISIETHGAMYINPYIKEINDWISNNDYIVWYKDGSDTVYVKNGLINITLIDIVKLHWTNFRLAYKKHRKTMKRGVKKYIYHFLKRRKP